MKIMLAAVIASMMLLPGCAHAKRREEGRRAAPAIGNWRSIATGADRDRIRRWRDAWTQGLAEVTSPVDRARVISAGILLEPDAAQMQPAPPPGNYRCRVTKIGSKIPDGMNYVPYPAFTCRISLDNGALSFTKVDGSQRQTGLLYPDDGGRLVFLGTIILGDETRALPYGRDPERDVAGLLERIGPRRWRLVMPFPHWESTVDVMELVPADG